MIVNFAKAIEKNQNNTHRKIDSKYEKLFDALINSGLSSQNKKANKILDDQLEKYSVIKESFPEAIKRYEYKKLDRELHKNNSPTKKLKI